MNSRSCRAKYAPLHGGVLATGIIHCIAEEYRSENNRSNIVGDADFGTGQRFRPAPFVAIEFKMIV